MGNSNSIENTNDFVNTNEKVTNLPVSLDKKILSDFRWTIKDFMEFTPGTSHESPRYEIMHADLKAPLYFKIRITLENGNIVLSIVNDNDIDVWMNAQFYVLAEGTVGDELSNIHPIQLDQIQSFLADFDSGKDKSFIILSNSKKVSSKLLQLHRVRSGKHVKIEKGFSGKQNSFSESHISTCPERLLSGGALKIGCKFSFFPSKA